MNMTHMDTRSASQLILPLRAARRAGHVSCSSVSCSGWGWGWGGRCRSASPNERYIKHSSTSPTAWRYNYSYSSYSSASPVTAPRRRPQQIQARSASAPISALLPLTVTSLTSLTSLTTTTTTTTIMPERIDIASLLPEGQKGDSVESKVASILDPALNGDSASADDVVNGVSSLYRSGHNTDDKAEDFFWAFWTLYIEVAKKVPARDERQERLVSIVGALKARDDGTVEIWGNDTKVWADLPMLGPCTREAWNFTPKFDGSQEDNEAVSSWISLNSFIARLLGTSATSGTDFAIWALREALEEDHSDSPASLDAHLAVAREWIAHAGQVLRDGAASHPELDETEQRMFKGGKLFDGAPGLNEERWAFWQRRLEELGGRTDSKEAAAQAQEAAEKMKALGTSSK